MSMLPNYEDYEDTLLDSVNVGSKTWVVSDGKLVETDDGLASVKQAIDIILQTERFNYQIYSTDFGIELSGVIGKEADYVESMIRRNIIEALEQDDRVQSVEDVKFEYNCPGSVLCKIIVSTVYGVVERQVEV